MVLLHRLVRNTAPQLKPFMARSMIGYGRFHYRYASGREGDWYSIGLASHTRYISMYFCVVERDICLAEYVKKALPKASIGKSCVRFKRLSDVDREVLKELIVRTARLARQRS